MKEFIEKLIGRLEECTSIEDYGEIFISLDEVYEIVNQLAEEYRQDLDKNSQGWISCSERLPEKTECYLVTWRDRVTCKNYVEIVEYDAGSKEWLDCICQAGLLGYDIIAWKPLPAPYQPKGE